MCKEECEDGALIFDCVSVHGCLFATRRQDEKVQETKQTSPHSRRPLIFPWEKSVQKHVMCFQYVFPEEK
jgi:hypothetical protein